MNKTLRTHRAHSVKMYFTKSCKHFRMKHNRNKKPCKDNHKALPVERKHCLGISISRLMYDDFIAF